MRATSSRPCGQQREAVGQHRRVDGFLRQEKRRPRLVPRRVRHCESLDPGDQDALTKLEELRAEFEPWATLMSSATGLKRWRGSSPQRQEISTSVTPNKLAKIMTEQFDWEENVARNIADAEFTIKTASGKCVAKTSRQKRCEV